ncbi:MAG: hypothetical protein KC553_15390 [Nitrospina sp.]|nr:hypothetical protein [Nitrospina sp.]
MKRMRVSGGKIRAAFYHKGKYRSDVLSDDPKDWDRAYLELVELRAKLNRGEDPKAIKSTFKEQADIFLGQVKKDYEGVESKLRVHLVPHFGKLSMSEINEAEVELFFRRKAVKLRGSTLDKLLVTLTRIMRFVDKSWSPPEMEWLDTSSASTLEALTVEEIFRVSHFVPMQSDPHGWKYELCFWTWTCTGMYPSDILSLTPRPDGDKRATGLDLKTGVVTKLRSKTKKYQKWIRVMMPGWLLEWWRKIPEPMGKGQTYFPELKPGNITKAICRAFEAAGVSGSGIDLRHHYESTLEHAGFRQTEDIAPTMGHVKGNKITARYAHAMMEKLSAMATVFDGHNPIVLAETLERGKGGVLKNSVTG